ncbi:MAG: bifunctional sugar phosphate isomerase/epimerase/4-hydroxyphenylpyruvate dioxygenase family protein, partial [Novosphingobium sp.]
MGSDFKTSIATVSISGSLDSKLRAIAAAGFDGAEIFENDLLSTNLSARDVSRMMADLGLACTMFQPFRDLEGLPEAQRTRAFDRLERKFDVMAELGTDLLLVCSSCSPQSEGDRGQNLADLHEAGERAARRGLRIGYEALAWGKHVNDHREAWGLVRDADHPALGLVLDSFHSLARKIPASSIGDIRPDKLFIVQVCDAPQMEMDYLGWSRHFRCMPGQGDLPLDEWADAIRQIGYQGYWSLEIFNDRFRAGSAKGVALDGYRSLRLLEGGISRSPARPTPALPPRPEPRRVEFIEFAASHEEADALGAMLRPLGFSPVARHRSKDVTRWTQGSINLVINCEPEGLAHSFDVVHGASVCAIGLAMDDVPAVLARANALRIEQFEQAVGSGEWPIPSLRGIGGSLLYFVDAATSAAMWEHEFPIALESCAPGALTSIDHIAQTMQFEEFLSGLLFYVSLLDLKKTPQLEIADPMGLVQSQAVESADGAVRFTLNGSLAAQSLSSRFIQNYFGAGVQHIAFGCSDIFSAADAAIAGGIDRLEIPRNYYEDLEARWGLDPELIEAMASRDILYDRDGEAEYFQFYTRAFARRVFFELVERRNYAG